MTRGGVFMFVQIICHAADVLFFSSLVPSVYTRIVSRGRVLTHILCKMLSLSSETFETMGGWRYGCLGQQVVSMLHLVRRGCTRDAILPLAHELLLECGLPIARMMLYLHGWVYSAMRFRMPDYSNVWSWRHGRGSFSPSARRLGLVSMQGGLECVPGQCVVGRSHLSNNVVGACPPYRGA